MPLDIRLITCVGAGAHLDIGVARQPDVQPFRQCEVARNNVGAVPDSGYLLVDLLRNLSARLAVHRNLLLLAVRVVADGVATFPLSVFALTDRAFVVAVFLFCHTFKSFPVDNLSIILILISAIHRLINYPR